MRDEWKRNPGARRASVGLLLVGLTIVGLIATIAAGVQTLSAWAALGLVVAATVGTFLVCWGLEDVR
jgi:membrane protein YqaA with SNARE-associated domain